MTLPLTPDMVRACYDFLAETPPFRRWNLPDSEDITFKIKRSRSTQGWHTWDGKKHVFSVSAALIGHTHRLVELVAHEMIHVHERHSNACVSGVEHSAAFKKWAEQVCKYHGFDPKGF